MKKGELLLALRTNPTINYAGKITLPTGASRKRYLAILADHLVLEHTHGHPLPLGVSLQIAQAANIHLHLRIDELILVHADNTCSLSREARSILSANQVRSDMKDHEARQFLERFNNPIPVALAPLPIVEELALATPSNEDKMTREQALEWSKQYWKEVSSFEFRSHRVHFASCQAVLANHRLAQQRMADPWLSAALSQAIFRYSYLPSSALVRRTELKDVGLMMKRLVIGEDGRRWKTTDLADELCVAAEIQPTIPIEYLEGLIGTFGTPKPLGDRFEKARAAKKRGK